MNVTAVAPSIATTWSGAASGTWDIGTTVNWKTAGTAGVYADGSPVLFDDADNTGGNFSVTNLNPVVVSPAGIVVNTTHGYAFGGTITIAGAGGLTLTGSGTVTNSGLNTYSGPTVVNSGVLMAGAASGLTAGPFGLDSSVSLANAAGVGLNLSGNNVAIGSLSGGGGLGGNVTLGSGTLTLGGDGTSQTFGGVISGSGGLTQIGGSLTLTNTNTFTGAISMTGTLTLAGTKGPLGNGVYAGSITDNGVFIYSSSGNQTNSGVISGTGSLTVNGPGALTLGNSGDVYSGQTTVNGGILVLGATTGGSGNIRNSIIVINPGGEVDMTVGDASGYGVSLPITNYGILKKTNVNQAETLFRPIYLSGGTMTSASFPGSRLYNFFGNFIATLPNTANYISGVGTFGLNTAGVYFNVGNNSTLTISCVASAGSLARGNFPGTITNYANFTYNSSASQVFSGAISNSGTIAIGSPAFVQIMAPISGPGTLVQNGPGTTLLYSNNSYTGLTTINGGKLVVFSYQTNTSPVTVNDGGALELNANVPSATGFSPTTLNVGSSAGAIVRFVLKSTTVAPLSPGTLNLTGNNAFNVVAGSDLVAGQDYPVLSYTTLSGSGSLLAANFSLPPGDTGTFSSSVNGGVTTWSVHVLTVTAPAASLWTGAVNNGTYGTWDINTTANWKTGGSAGNYLDG
ncbi:MAG: autotransporter-associated beta strand repeat-containing protein, partial [Tepidisphaeraceae bacterium]